MYFVTTNNITSPSKLWKVEFTDINNPELGGTITSVLDGTEGQKMLDNMTVDSYGHALLQEDVGNNVHIGKIHQYTIATDQLLTIAEHDANRFISGAPNFLTQDEEASGIIEASFLGTGNFLMVDQAHYAQPGQLVEGGQILALFNPATFAACPPSTWYADTDNDGFGAQNDSVLACDAPVGYVSNNKDCDDTNASITDKYTLQLLHASDFEAASSAVADAPRFAALVDAFDNAYPNTLIVSSGDNILPSPFSFSGEDPSLVTPLKNAYISYYGSNFANNDLRAGIARPDISILNFIGVEASVLGNHEFDLGTPELRNVIAGANSGVAIRWFGAQFPYLSSNLNFTGDVNLSNIFTPTRQQPAFFKSNPTMSAVAIAATPKLAPSCFVIKGGQKIGVVGVTTPILAAISSPGTTTVKNPGAGTENMALLATIIQPYIDSLRNQEGIEKIILLAHLQQLSNEKALAVLLNGVDIIVAGGSNTLMADSTDRLRAGDVAAETYPYLTVGADGFPVAIVNTAGEFTYLGRLVVDFDCDNHIIPSSINAAISGAYAADSIGVVNAWGTYAAAFTPGSKASLVKSLCDAVGSVIATKDGDIYGKTSVYLEGRRNFVRTEETNLGNLSADANLWLGKFYDNSVTISIKNGGGIRSSIGAIEAVGSVVTVGPPAANPSAGKLLGDISRLDIENSLRFNNLLSTLTLTAANLRTILEHGVAASGPGQTQGRFPQISGVRFSYNETLPAGSRILNAVITDNAGNTIDSLVVNGAVYGNPSRTFRVITLNFLAGGGDGYPFNTLATGRVDLNTLSVSGPNNATFAIPGSEQDAFAEYMKNFHTVTPYNKAETPASADIRIQEVNDRIDCIYPTTSTTTITACDSFTWNAITYTTSGVYTYTTLNSVGCDSIATLNLTINSIASYSVLAGSDQSVCANSNVILDGTIGGGVLNASWSSTGTGSFSPSANVLNATYIPSPADYTNGSVSLVLTTNTIVSCGFKADTTVITFIALPASPASLTGPTAICNPSSGAVFTYTATPVVGATSYSWTVPAGATIQGSATGSSISVRFNASSILGGIGGSICVTANNSNGCGNSAPTCLAVSVQISAPVQPNSISGSAKACPGDVAVYSVAPVSKATSYIWSIPANTTITAGAGTNVITLSFDAGFTSGTLSVASSNVCGTSLTRSRSIVPNVLAAPASISGVQFDGVCGATVTYSASVAGASSYVWTLPAGATGTSTTNSIDVTFTNSFTTGTISVAGVNNCGTGNVRSVTVKGAPGLPGVISGPSPICASSTNTYSIAVVQGATSYDWTVPTGVINSGQGTKTINMTYGSAVSPNGLVTVKAVNACGNSSTRILSVVTLACPRIGNDNSTSGVSIYPNPANENVTIEFTADKAQNATITLTDATGRVVYNAAKDVVEGFNATKIAVNEFATGIYTLQLQTINGTQQFKVIVE
jgi:2',3'-cyclic-nucleotide 2'-phosphodiesterase (5'-nucleotidase family)